MAERRKSRKKKEQEIKDDDPKPSKEEYAVAKFLRQKLPEKKTTLLGHKVEYFIASKAIDCLLDSPWATKKDKAEFLFTSRDTVVEFLDKMLQHKFFHRAKKIIVQKDGKKKKKEKDDEGNLTEDGKEKEQKKAKEKEKEKIKADDEKKGEEKKENEGFERKKEKKKIKLDMHMEQVFVDGNEAYVWIYDPIPVRTWIIGTLMVVGAVLVCLFPLWPRTIRHYIYYLSVAAAGFLVFIIGLAVVRLVVFVAIWMVTFGKHHLWLLPNLTEDVGFFESFWPLYKYEYKGSKNKKTKEKKEDRKEKGEETKETENNDQDKDDSSTDQESKEADHVHTDSERDSEGDKNKTDNGDNGFEIVDAEEGMDQDDQEARKNDE